MSITEGTQPAVLQWTGAWTTNQTTASFTPESGALLVALVAGDGAANSAITDAVTDSLGGTWTLLKRQNGVSATLGGVASVWCRDSPGSALTVSVKNNNELGAGSTGGQLVVRTLIGAKATAQQNGATGGASVNAAVQVSVASGTGGKIYGAAFNYDNSTAMTALANTSVVSAFSDTTNGDDWEAFKSSGDTAGTATYGYSTSHNGSIAAVEILAAPSTGASTVQAAQPFPSFSPPFTDPIAIPFQLLGDATTATTAAVTLTDSGAAADQISVSTVDQNQASPPVAWMFLQPNAAAFQLLGDASSAINIGLTDIGAESDSVTVAAAVPLSDAAAGDDQFSVSVAVPLTEAGTGDDTSITVSAAVPLTDAGSGADSILVNTGPDPYQAPDLPFPPFAAPFIEPSAVPFQLLGDTSGIPQISLTDSGAGAETVTVTASVPLADTGSAADSATVSAAVPVTDSGAGADAVTATATVTLADTATGADSLTVTVLDQGATAGPQMVPPFGPPFAIRWILPFQQQGDSTPILITTVPPYTITATDQPLATVTAATSSATVTGSDKALVTVTGTAL